MAPPVGAILFGHISFTMSGIMFGIVVSSLVFIPVAALPEDQLLSWRWRIPFWLSIVVTALAWFLRRSLHEPEVFADVQEHEGTATAPVVELFRGHWATVLRVAVCATFTRSTRSSTFSPRRPAADGKVVTDADRPTPVAC